MSDEPLIPLSWLRQEWKRAHANWAYNNGGGAYDMWRSAIDDEISRRTIAELRQRVEALEAELRSAKRWEPVENVTDVYCICGCKRSVVVGRDGDALTVLEGKAAGTTLVLPDEYRFCRLVAGQEGQGKAHGNHT